MAILTEKVPIWCCHFGRWPDLSKKFMMLRVLLLLTILVSNIWASELRFKEDRKSLVDWDNLKAKDWLSFDNWKDSKKFKENYPLWRDLQKMKGLREEMGRVIKCVGECTLFRGLGSNQLNHRSLIKEADDIETGVDSYLWLMLFDGTLIRMSPESSISFKEINILKDEVFFNIRANVGNLLFLSRSKEKVQVNTVRDTDSIFLPLPILEANPIVMDDQTPLMEYLYDSGLKYRSMAKFINDEIEKNNKKVFRKSRFFIHSPLYSFEAYSPSFETYVSIGDDSYLKFRDEEQLGIKNEEASKPVINLRGYANEEMKELDYGSWYRLSQINRNIIYVSDNKFLSQNEFITKRIQGIYYIRELFFSKYGTPTFAKFNEAGFAKEFGMKLWSKEELKKRIAFLWTNTREVETTNLAIADRYRKDILGRADRRDKDVLRKDFYSLALESYYRVGATENSQTYFPKLNSEKKELWKKLYGINTKVYPGLRKPAPQGTFILDENSN